MFEPFGCAHLIAVAVLILACLALWFALRNDRRQQRARGVAPIFAAVLAVHELVNVALHVGWYGDRWIDALPLNICRANMWVAALMLWRKSYLAYEVAYFWAIVGSGLALVTPDLKEPFPHPLFVTFFLGHALGIVAVLFATWALRFRPRVGSIAVAIGAVFALALPAAFANARLGTNYLYLSALPKDSPLRGWLAPWPIYLGEVLAAGVVGCFLAYLPFALFARPRARRGSL